jgi:hypothetical protein
LNRVYIDIEVIIFIHTITIFQITIRGILKEQEESNKTQLEEKKEEITRLKNEKEDLKVDDDISKSFETIVHLKTQIEEAKRVE